MAAVVTRLAGIRLSVWATGLRATGIGATGIRAAGIWVTGIRATGIRLAAIADCDQSKTDCGSKSSTNSCKKYQKKILI